MQQEREANENVPSLLQGVFGSESTNLKSWKTERIADDLTLLPLMDGKGIVYKAIPESNNYLLDLLIRMIIPIALMLFIWRYVLKRMGGFGGSNVMSFGQNNAKIVAEKDLITRFNDVAGCDEVTLAIISGPTTTSGPAGSFTTLTSGSVTIPAPGVTTGEEARIWLSHTGTTAGSGQTVFVSDAKKAKSGNVFAFVVTGVSLPGSLLSGLLWEWHPAAPFLVGGGVILVGMLVFIFGVPAARTTAAVERPSDD